MMLPGVLPHPREVLLKENNNGDHVTVAGQAFHGSQASEEGARISQT
jgi:hypothetical protein